MRFKVTLNIDKQAFGNSIPINYQYEQSAVIYKILSQASTNYATWLHDNGFTVEDKQFKLFTYSRFYIPRYTIDKENALLIINSDTIEWSVSFLPEESTEKFIQGVFMNQTFQLGNKKNKIQCGVKSIEVLPTPPFEDEMTFETLSPICIALRRDEDGRTDYLSPEDPRAKESILHSLLNRYEAFHGKPYSNKIDFDFKVLNKPKPVLITFKAGTLEESKVKGYMCRFDIRLNQKLMKIMYESGIGMKGSQGWGMVKVCSR